MQIETERLNLVPLTAKQLRLWMENQLEQTLACSYQAEPLEGFFLEVVKAQVEATEKDPENYVWHSFWFLIRRLDSVVVGSAVFKNVPDAKGEVELGYGLGKAHEHNGYMTEAVDGLCRWAMQQEGVTNVTAETEKDTLPSHNILKRCGFTLYKEGETLWWRLES
jgi:RimJ/RimL family protein N-acetyltransferase